MHMARAAGQRAAEALTGGQGAGARGQGQEGRAPGRQEGRANRCAGAGGSDGGLETPTCLRFSASARRLK